MFGSDDGGICLIFPQMVKVAQMPARTIHEIADYLLKGFLHRSAFIAFVQAPKH